jgi:hypothetical protein
MVMGDENFYELCATFIGMIFGVAIYWIVTVPYLPDFFPMMTHGLYVFGITIITIIIVLGYIVVDKNHWPVFTSLWLFIAALWVMFAYAIYGVINLFIAWWRSSLSFNTGLILMVLAVFVLVFWGLRELYYKEMEKKIYEN